MTTLTNGTAPEHPHKSKRTSRSEAHVTWIEEHDAFYDACLDALLSRPAPQAKLRDILWRMGPKLVDAIRRGHTGREIWMTCRQGLPQFAFRYRAFARALADFREVNGLGSAYVLRQRKPKTTDVAPGTTQSVTNQAGLPHPTAMEATKAAITEGVSISPSSQSGKPKPAPSQVNDDKLQAFLDKTFPMKYQSGVPYPDMEQQRQEHMRRREERAEMEAETTYNQGLWSKSQT